MVTPISIKLTLSETIIFNLAQVRTQFTRLFDALLRFVFKQGGGGGEVSLLENPIESP